MPTSHTHRHKHSHREKDSHREKSGHREEGERRGNRRSAANSESVLAAKRAAAATAATHVTHSSRDTGTSLTEAAITPHATHVTHSQRRTGSTGVAASGKNASAACVLLAFLGLGIVAIAELISRTNSEPSNPFFNIMSGACTLAALGMGIYAQAAQFHHWSQRVKRRLLIGFPVALLTALVVADNFYDKYENLDVPPPTPPPAGQPAAQHPAAAAAVAQEDDALVKPGWYGELQQDGLFLIVSSFGDNTAEARQFNRRLIKPVSYASLSLINAGSHTPVSLQSLQVGLHLDSGETVQSQNVRALLEQKAAVNADLLQRLTVPHDLVAGTMLPDIPVCMGTNFTWANVTAVSVTLSSRTVTLPGRMMTAAEKQALLDKSTANRQPDGTNTSSEAWFKNF